MSPARRVATAITVDLTLCKSCGICSTLCPRDVFDTDERGFPVVARPVDCSVCFACEWHCPDFAIEITYADAPRTAKAGAASAKAGSARACDTAAGKAGA